jgi:catechol 2,3-dioxygenase-like lactoylglutathione lyase family enzyme
MDLRVARHTERLEEVVAFYRDGLGLREVGRFRDHESYDGVFLEIPGSGAHLELTSGGRHGTPEPDRSKGIGASPPRRVGEVVGIRSGKRTESRPPGQVAEIGGGCATFICHLAKVALASGGLRRNLMEPAGFEPAASYVQGRRSTN